jgi:hypothetical protein
MFAGGMQVIHRRGAAARAVRGIPERLARASLWFNIGMAAVLLVVATVAGSGDWFLVWLVVVVLGNFALRRLLR